MKTQKLEIKAFEKKLSSAAAKNRVAGIRKFCFQVFIILSHWFGRLCEWAVAFVLFIILSLPVLLFCVVRKIINGKEIFSRKTIYGLNGKIATIRFFNFFHIIPSYIFLFFHVLTLDIRLIGVSIKELGKDMRTVGDTSLYIEKPGIFNLWFLRNSSRIGHEGKMQVELEYTFKRGFIGDAMLLLRSLPAVFFHTSSKETFEQISIMGVTFQNLTMKKAVEMLRQGIAEKKQGKVYFVNPDCFNKTVHNKAYFKTLCRADYILPDGIGVLLACKFKKTPLKENVNGTDMLPYVCKMAVKNKYSIYLLGARAGVASAMAGRLKRTYSGVNICGTHHGFISDEKERNSVIKDINAVAPDILLVAMGTPAQEIWIDRFAPELKAGVIIGVGGLFDFYSGNTPRAPRWMREIGLEWLYRLLQEPRRMFFRYIIGNPLFLWRAWRSRRSE
ncbi:MAG: WecB/TagA/CpsF family glycosyltransferase [Lentisphaerae bacterium]|nr:WecB/TagA/CpsF family glycosyltransferase [Lentisphaerota bacterium]MCP4103597.1 WecB/TagA/CpsF family glycosyltransferase [Lentisphaerota bacterium]